MTVDGMHLIAGNRHRHTVNLIMTGDACFLVNWNSVITGVGEFTVFASDVARACGYD